MHPQTLRIYERRGLVSPARTEGGNRRYSDEDIEVLRADRRVDRRGAEPRGHPAGDARWRAENGRLRDELEQGPRDRPARDPRGGAGRLAQHSGGDLVPLQARPWPCSGSVRASSTASDQVAFPSAPKMVGHSLDCRRSPGSVASPRLAMIGGEKAAQGQPDLITLSADHLIDVVDQCVRDQRRVACHVTSVRRERAPSQGVLTAS